MENNKPNELQKRKQKRNRSRNNAMRSHYSIRTDVVLLDKVHIFLNEYGERQESISVFAEEAMIFYLEEYEQNLEKALEEKLESFRKKRLECQNNSDIPRYRGFELNDFNHKKTKSGRTAIERKASTYFLDRGLVNYIDEILNKYENRKYLGDYIEEAMAQYLEKRKQDMQKALEEKLKKLKKERNQNGNA